MIQGFLVSGSHHMSLQVNTLVFRVFQDSQVGLQLQPLGLTLVITNHCYSCPHSKRGTSIILSLDLLFHHQISLMRPSSTVKINKLCQTMSVCQRLSHSVYNPIKSLTVHHFTPRKIMIMIIFPHFVLLKQQLNCHHII